MPLEAENRKVSPLLSLPPEDYVILHRILTDFRGPYYPSSSLWNMIFDRETLDAPLDDMPLLINDPDINTRALAQWRLRIGK